MYIVYYSVYHDYFGVFIDIVVSVSYYVRLYPYRNVWPEVVYIQQLQLFTCYFIRDVGLYHFTKFHYSTPSGF